MSITALVSPVPDADEARRILEEELSKSVYVEARPNLLERIISDILRAAGRFIDGLGGLGPGAGTLVLALGAAVVVVLAIVLTRPRSTARGPRREQGVFDGGARLSAADHRNRSSVLAADGDWNGALAELLRAIIRSAEERVLLDEQPGRTASEAAVQLGGVFPSAAAEISWLAELFNETRYGRGAASHAQYERVAALEARLSAAQPARTGPPATPAAPR
ncbi:DUF4129 domain-containing protein [Arthrobacter echini]|uniref:DUF4129 domain-containing protein n=1 Tax=Arthrobacter echini TaxID=1529066 RepID=UPI001455E603|nr:DUF4129 domain-containing protein [Arthrobacter echini]